MQTAIAQKKYSELTDSEKIRLLESVVANILIDSCMLEEDEMREVFNDPDKSIDLDLIKMIESPLLPSSDPKAASVYSKLKELDDE